MKIPGVKDCREATSSLVGPFAFVLINFFKDNPNLHLDAFLNCFYCMKEFRDDGREAPRIKDCLLV